MYDESGRVLEAVTVREPEWDAGQVSLLAAHLRAKREPRGSHGLLLSEATASDVDPSKPGGRRVVVEGPTFDFAAQELAKAQKAYYDKYPKHDSAGDLWSVKLVDPPSTAAE